MVKFPFGEGAVKSSFENFEINFWFAQTLPKGTSFEAEENSLSRFFFFFSKG